jgi:hypothetical protein
MVENWTALGIGIIMIVSPWVLGFSDISLAKWCNILLGLALVVVNAWKLFEEISTDTAAASESQVPTQKGKRRAKNNVEQK